ncbi:DUF4915 domain-containing protein [Priestia megaterium]|uniref:DUF4915 domain-containing protein n=1 Tax=Priestia megaterium TaxID=1404 RepID=UPI00366D5D5F
MIEIMECQLLITCCNQDGGLYIANFKDGTHSLKKVLNIECRGIAKYKDHFIVVSTNGILILNENLDVIQTKKLTEMLDLHGIAIYKDQAFIVETTKNSIGIYDLKKNIDRVDEIKLSPENHDTCHINDIFIQDDKAYISMFSYIDKSSFLSKISKNSNTQGVILEYSLLDKKRVRIMQNNLFQPHSLKIYKEELYYCTSAKFLVQKNEKIIFKGLGYLRGLDIKNEMIFIGQSESRHVDRLLKEQNNILFDCGIYIHNMSTKMSSFIHVPSKEIYQILII